VTGILIFFKLHIDSFTVSLLLKIGIDWVILNGLLCWRPYFPSIWTFICK